MAFARRASDGRRSPPSRRSRPACRAARSTGDMVEQVLQRPRHRAAVDRRREHDRVGGRRAPRSSMPCRRRGPPARAHRRARSATRESSRSASTPPPARARSRASAQRAVESSRRRRAAEHGDEAPRRHLSRHHGPRRPRPAAGRPARSTGRRTRSGPGCGVARDAEPVIHERGLEDPPERLGVVGARGERPRELLLELERKPDPRDARLAQAAGGGEQARAARPRSASGRARDRAAAPSR